MHTKTLLAVTPNGTFPIFITSTNAGIWSASCLYSDDKRILKAPGESRNYTFELHREVAETVDLVVSAMKTWLNSHFGGDIPVRESKRSSDHLFRLLFEASKPTIDFSVPID